MSGLRQLADRTAVLFLGVGVGTAMGYAFAGDLHKMMSGDAAEVGQAATPRAPEKPPVETAAARQPIAIECAMPFQPRLLGAVERGEKVRVGVFGDSFGDGVWAALYHQLPARDAFEVIKFSQQSTGFTRYASLNLEDHVREQLASRPVDIAVISFGANDTQGVMHNGKVAPLLTPAWKEEIGARIERYIGVLRKQGAVVYWVGLPVMRKPSFDADISGMSAFFADEMKRLEVPFIDTRPMSVDTSGAYAAYLPDPGSQTPKLVRANDGIHMSMGGYQRLTGGLADRIRRYVALARAHAARDGMTAPTTASNVATPPRKPDTINPDVRAIPVLRTIAPGAEAKAEIHPERPADAQEKGSGQGEQVGAPLPEQSIAAGPRA